jgi:hypothetical protein
VGRRNGEIEAQQKGGCSGRRKRRQIHGATEQPAESPDEAIKRSYSCSHITSANETNRPFVAHASACSGEIHLDVGQVSEDGGMNATTAR